jgi:hypothetical protein
MVIGAVWRPEKAESLPPLAMMQFEAQYLATTGSGGEAMSNL